MSSLWSDNSPVLIIGAASLRILMVQLSQSVNLLLIHTRQGTIQDIRGSATDLKLQIICYILIICR